MLNRTLREICGGWLLACWMIAPQARAAAPAVAWNVAFSRTFTGDDVFRSSFTDAAGNTYALYERYNGGGHLLVYSPAGILQRDDYLPDPNNMQYRFIAVDGAGHLYAATEKFSGTSNIQVAQYDLATLAQLWEAPAYDSGQDDYVNGITADPAGGVLIAGNTRNGGTGDENGLLVKFTALGVQAWARTVDFGLSDVAFNAAADSAGNAYMFGKGNVTADGQDAIFAARYVSSSGTLVWTRTIESGVGLYNGVGAVWPGTSTVFLAGGDDVDTFTVVRLDGAGNVSASGWFTDANTPAFLGAVTADGQGRPTLAGNTCCDAGGVSDAVLVRFTAALGVEPGSSLHVDSGGRDAEAFNTLPQVSLGADPSGSVYLAMPVEGGSVGCFNRRDASVRKFGVAPGAVAVWARTFDGPADIRVQGAARDAAGNLYVSTAIANSKIAGLIKYAPDGHVLWDTYPVDNAYCAPNPSGNGTAQNAVTAFMSATATRISNNGRELLIFKRDAATGAAAGRIIVNAVPDLDDAPIAVDPGGNIYLASKFYSATTFQTDLYISKIDAADSPVWSKTISNQAEDNVRSVALDGAGHVYLLGVNDGRTCYVVSKYDAATGTKLWSRSYAGGLQTVLEGGNLVARGNRLWFSGTDMQGFLAAANGRVFALDDTGAVLWTQTVTAPSTNIAFEGLDVDAAGRVFATGAAYPPSTQILDLYSAALAADGTLLWTQRYDTGSAGDIGYVAVAADPGVYVVGTTQNDARIIRYQDAVTSGTTLRAFDKDAVAYPNPVSGDTMNLALKLGGDAAEVTVRAYAPSGRVAYEGVFRNVGATDGGVVLSGLSHWAPGRYILKIRATLAGGTTTDFPAIKVIVRR